MTVHCHNCGKEWDEDPRLQVPCPQCPADVGQPCRRPSDHRCRPHVDREKLAIDEGVFEKQCPAVHDGETVPDVNPEQVKIGWWST